jgi:hypothetical protein
MMVVYSCSVCNKDFKYEFGANNMTPKYCSTCFKKQKIPLTPLSKDAALGEIKKFRKDMGIEGIHTTRKRVKNILKKSGPLSE